MLSTFYGHHNDLVNRYGISVSHMSNRDVMSFFPLVVSKPITISEYPRSLRFSHAAVLKQLTSLVIKTLSPLEIKRRIEEPVQLYFIENNEQRK